MSRKPFLRVVLGALLTSWIVAGMLSPNTARAACVEGEACPPIADAAKGLPDSAGQPRPTEETPADPAKAAGKKGKTITWTFQNQTSRRIDFQLYSKTRAWVWPESNRIWYLPDRRQYTVSISCKKNEKVCYGAWYNTDTSTYWGVGKGGQQGCSNCCYSCTGGRTPVIRLLP